MDYPWENWHRLSPRGGAGLACDEAGAALGPAVVVAVRKRRGGEAFRARPAKQLGQILALAYGPKAGDAAPRVRAGLARIAKALNNGQPALAAICAVQMRLPEIAPEGMAKLAGAGDLLKYDPDQPRLPAGGPGGGEWAGGGGAGDDNDDDDWDDDDDGGENTMSPSPPVQVAQNTNAETMTDVPAPLVAPSAIGPSPTPPAYKSSVVSQADWQNFLDALDDANLTPEQQFIYSEIFAAEGGFRVNPQNGAFAGITWDIFDAARNATTTDFDPAGLEATTAKPCDLSPDQVAALYSFYFDQAMHTVGGSNAAAQIGDPYAAAALYDTMFFQGATAGPLLIQQAIDQVAGPETVDVSGGMGPATLAAYAQLASDPDTHDQLLDALAEQRIAFTKKQQQIQINRGVKPAPIDLARINYFRFLNERS
jgi:lysozyme family protein